MVQVFEPYSNIIIYNKITIKRILIKHSCNIDTASLFRYSVSMLYLSCIYAVSMLYPIVWMSFNMGSGSARLAIHIGVPTGFPGAQAQYDQ